MRVGNEKTTISDKVKVIEQICVLDTVLVKYSFKNVLGKTPYTLTVFEILLFEGESKLPPRTHLLPVVTVGMRYGALCLTSFQYYTRLGKIL